MKSTNVVRTQAQGRGTLFASLSLENPAFDQRHDGS